MRENASPLQDAPMIAEQPPQTAIRPYPSQYVSQWQMKDGTPIAIRPIRPEDEPLMVKFHNTLSERSVYLRYFCSLSLRTRVEHKRLVRICFGNFDRELALVVDRKNPVNGEHEILGVGRLSRLSNRSEGEVAIIVSDQWQGRGLGTELLNRVVHVARQEKFKQISGEILRDNLVTQAIFRKAGFRLRFLRDPSTVLAELEL
jgi:acetyltransferase